MASTPKQANGNSPPNNNGSGGKRKKSKGKGTYLSKWLDKTMRDIQEPPSLEMYDSFINSNVYPMGNPQFSPGYNPYKFNTYGCAPEPTSLPSLPTYYNSFIPPPYSDYRNSNNHHGIQTHKPPSRRRNGNRAEEVASFPADMNQKSYLELKQLSDSQDFASLPPIVTSMGDTNSNSDFPEHIDRENSNNTRRFSDPCLRGLPDVEREANGNADSDSDASSGLSGSQVGSRLLSCLLDQIATLKVANGRLTKELQETRAELDSLRQNGYFKGSGAMGPIPNLNNNGQYSPGCVTELVREIRDATRLREEAMYARLRAMLIERTDSGLASTESKLAERTLDEIKSSLRASEADKRLMMDRIAKLEEELRHLRLTGCESEYRVNGNDEDERARMRRELTELKRSKNADHSKLERLLTQLLSKFNGPQITNGPDSLQSDHDSDIRPRRISTSNSTNALANITNALTNNLPNLANSTVVFGPVTDL